MSKAVVFGYEDPEEVEGKASEASLASAIQAWVWELGNVHRNAAYIIRQIDGPWLSEKDYILKCIVNAYKSDGKNVTPQDVYSYLREDSMGGWSESERVCYAGETSMPTDE